MRRVRLPADVAGRLDKALAAALPELSRSRLQALIAAGEVAHGETIVRDPAARAEPGQWSVRLPPPAPASPAAEAHALEMLFEDAHLIVIAKPAGMSTHPAPGSASGTLVNALLHHCGASLSGIGGVARPGIVHRLDKLTSGVMAAAKSDAAHRALSAMFAERRVERVYLALCRGAPERESGRIEAALARSSRNRQKMAVARSGGRAAATNWQVVERFESAALLACRLETGRTHQIRVHLASIGHPVLGDPLYGAGGPAPQVRQAMGEAGLERQALHAALLGFHHPVTGEELRFSTPPPADMAVLLAELRRFGSGAS